MQNLPAIIRKPSFIVYGRRTNSGSNVAVLCLWGRMFIFGWVWSEPFIKPHPAGSRSLQVMSCLLQVMSCLFGRIRLKPSNKYCGEGLDSSLCSGQWLRKDDWFVFRRNNLPNGMMMSLLLFEFHHLLKEEMSLEWKNERKHYLGKIWLFSNTIGSLRTPHVALMRRSS